MPVYNVEKYIKQTIDNIVCQSFADWELILVLDAPTDNTESIIDSIAPTDPRIHVIKQPFNRGVSAARNIGIKSARGKYLHFIDSDDFINLDFYKNLFTAAESTNADIAVSGVINERRPQTNRVFTEKIVITNNQDKLDFTNVQNDGWVWRYLINRQFWMRSKFVFDEKLKIFEDLAIAPKLVCATDKIVLVPDSIYLYRKRENSLITSEDKAKRKQKLQVVVSKVSEFMNENKLVDNINSLNIRMLRHERVKVFGKFTLARRKVFSNGVTKIYFLGLPIIKITD